MSPHDDSDPYGINSQGHTVGRGQIPADRLPRKSFGHVISKEIVRLAKEWNAAPPAEEQMRRDLYRFAEFVIEKATDRTDSDGVDK